jgi:hypothetical protein
MCRYRYRQSVESLLTAEIKVMTAASGFKGRIYDAQEIWRSLNALVEQP